MCLLPEPIQVISFLVFFTYVFVLCAIEPSARVLRNSFRWGLCGQGFPWPAAVRRIKAYCGVFLGVLVLSTGLPLKVWGTGFLQYWWRGSPPASSAAPVPEELTQEGFTEVCSAPDALLETDASAGPTETVSQDDLEEGWLDIQPPCHSLSSDIPTVNFIEGMTVQILAKRLIHEGILAPVEGNILERETSAFQSPEVNLNPWDAFSVPLSTGLLPSLVQSSDGLAHLQPQASAGPSNELGSGVNPLPPVDSRFPALQGDEDFNLLKPGQPRVILQNLATKRPFRPQSTFALYPSGFENLNYSPGGQPAQPQPAALRVLLCADLCLTAQQQTILDEFSLHPHLQAHFLLYLLAQSPRLGCLILEPTPEKMPCLRRRISGAQGREKSRISRCQNLPRRRPLRPTQAGFPYLRAPFVEEAPLKPAEEWVEPSVNTEPASPVESSPLLSLSGQPPQDPEENFPFEKEETDLESAPQAEVSEPFVNAPLPPTLICHGRSLNRLAGDHSGYSGASGLPPKAAPYPYPLAHFSMWVLGPLRKECIKTLVLADVRLTLPQAESLNQALGEAQHLEQLVFLRTFQKKEPEPLEELFVPFMRQFAFPSRLRSLIISQNDLSNCPNTFYTLLEKCLQAGLEKVEFSRNKLSKICCTNLIDLAVHQAGPGLAELNLSGNPGVEDRLKRCPKGESLLTRGRMPRARPIVLRLQDPLNEGL